MILVELTAAVDAEGGTETHYLSTEAFVTKPTDTPPNQAFRNRLIDPGAISISIYADSTAGGASKLELGEIVAANKDGEFDAWKDYAFDGREIVVRVGEPGGAYPQDYPAVLAATIERVDITWDKLVIKARDRSYIFQRPVLTQRFLGTNAGADGLEGTADDIKGRIVPRVYGRAPNIAPPCVNIPRQVYRVSDGAVADISAVYIRQAAQTRGVDHPTGDDLLAATVAAGTYQTCLSEGLFKLGAVDGLVTADVVEGGAASDRTAAQLLQRLAIAAGVSAVDIVSADIDSLDGLNPAELGFYLDDETTFLDVMDRIAQSVGAWFAFDPLGKLRIGRLDPPTGAPVATLQKHEELDGVERTTLRDQPAPLWSVTIRHTPIWTTQTTDLAGAVDPARRAFLAEPYRAATASEATIRIKHRMAGSAEIETYLTSATDAEAEAQRQLAIHGSQHDVFAAPVPIDRLAELMDQNGLFLGKELGLDLDRFGLSGGKSFVLLGIRYERRAKRASLVLWGGDQVVLPTVVRGIISAIGVAAGLGEAIGVGDSLGGSGSGGGSPIGLLLALTRSDGGGSAPPTGSGSPIGLLLAITGAGGSGGQTGAIIEAIGSASGAGAATATGTTTSAVAAKNLKTWRESIGACVHMDWDFSPYADRQKVLDCLNYLGINRVRDFIESRTYSQTQCGWLADQGIKFEVIANGGTNPSPSSQVTRWANFMAAHPGSIIGIEGPNEVDGGSFPISYNSKTGPEAGGDFVRDLYAAIKANSQLANVPVYAPSVATVSVTPYQQLGDLSMLDGGGNSHIYWGGGQPSYGWDVGNNNSEFNWDNWLASARIPVGATKPVLVTETGSSSAPGADGPTGIDEIGQQRTNLNVLCVAAYYGNSGVYIYELIESRDFAEPHAENHFGMFDHDTYSAKPVAVALRNLLQLWSGGEPNITGALPYTVSGLSAVGKHILFRKTATTFSLAVWAEPDIYNESTDVRITPPSLNVTVSLGVQASAIRVYDPVVGTSAQQTQGASSAVTFSVTDHPVIVEIDVPA